MNTSIHAYISRGHYRHTVVSGDVADALAELHRQDAIEPPIRHTYVGYRISQWELGGPNGAPFWVDASGNPISNPFEGE